MHVVVVVASVAGGARMKWFERVEAQLKCRAGSAHTVHGL